MKKMVLFLFVVVLCSAPLRADETISSPKIFYKGDGGLVVDGDDLRIEREVLSKSLQVTDEKVVEVILSNKLFGKEVLKKFKNDRQFNKRFQLAQVKYLGLFYREELKKKITVGEDLVRSYYLASPDEFTLEKAYELQLTAHNFRIIAEKNYNDLVTGRRTFEEIVAEESVDGKSVEKRGDIGWLLVSKMPRAFVDITKDMKEGDISHPFRYGGKWMILKAVKVQESKKIPFDAVKELIRNKLQAKHWARALADETERLKKKYHVEKQD